MNNHFDAEEFVRQQRGDITTEELVQMAYERGRLSAFLKGAKKSIESEFMPHFRGEDGKTT